MKHVLLGLCLCIASCSPLPASKTSSVDIPNTSIKWQTIGNCWAYGALGWAEAVIIRDTGARVNFSETYMTYRDFEDQLLAGATEIKTGGSFFEARRLIEKYGLLYEGDFVPGESETSFSKTQKSALAYIEKSLLGGVLADLTSRDAALVRSELDKAFGVELANVQAKIFKSSSVQLAERDLRSEMRRMNYVYYSRSGELEESLPNFYRQYSANELSVQRRVMRALADGKPVVMNWFVDFNALSSKGIFSSEGLTPGRQGYHSVVIEDFTAEGMDDTGASFLLDEGAVDREYLDLAIRWGHITSLIIKNSWGGSDRPDRPSYTVRGESGFAKLLDNYAFGSIKEMTEVKEDASAAGEPAQVPKFKQAVHGVQSFLLPTGY